MQTNRFLALYSGAVTAVLCFVVFVAAKPQSAARFDTLDVQRINVREPDGTLRMVISNHAKFPGIIVRGKCSSSACTTKTTASPDWPSPTARRTRSGPAASGWDGPTTAPRALDEC
jgi:hypothetical protein